jgi:hypothetical protein
MPVDRFSERQGFALPDVPITIREEAPTNFRYFLPQIAGEFGLSPHAMRSIVCDLLYEAPDSNNWSEGNVHNEVEGLIDGCAWFQVYDIAEVFFDRLNSIDPDRATGFANKLNDFFRRRGIGWQLADGRISVRGSDVFNATVHSAEHLPVDRFQVANNEMREALADISRRPSADITGAVQHSMAALECVARVVTGNPSATLGQLARRDLVNLGVQPPLDQAVEKLWGYASGFGRHLQEGNAPNFNDAQLVVGVCAGLCVYLAKISEL